METNNLGENDMEINATADMSTNHDEAVSNVNQSNSYYQSPNQVNGTASENTPSAPKKRGPLIAFGIIMVVAVVLVVTLFIENKNGLVDEKNKLINEKTRTLIVYFSHDGENYGRNLNIENKTYLKEGNTEIMAKRIATLISADLYEIKPVVPYPQDLEELYASTKIEYNKNTYPEISNAITNLGNYDVIFIGYPIWHSSYPQIIKTFVRDNKNVLKNKIIVPFNTHAGSGSAGTYKKLFNLIDIPEDKGLNGLAINGTEVETSDNIIKNWLEGLGYKLK